MFTSFTNKKNLIVTFVISTIILTTSLYNFNWTPTINGTIENAKKEQGHAYLYFFPKLQGLQKYFYKIDGQYDEDNLKLYVDGVLLKYGNQKHKFIRNMGEGRYSFLGTTLLFSLPDNNSSNNLHKITYTLKLISKSNVVLYIVFLSAMFSIVSFLCLVGLRNSIRVVTLISILSLCYLTYLYCHSVVLTGQITSPTPEKGYMYSYKIPTENTYIKAFYDVKDNYGVTHGKLWLDNKLIMRNDAPLDAMFELGDGKTYFDGSTIYFSTFNNAHFDTIKSATYELELVPNNTLLLAVGLLFIFSYILIGIQLRSLAIAKIIYINLSIFGVFFLTIFLIGEVYFRIKYDIKPNTWPALYTPNIGFTFKPNSTLDLTNNVNFFNSSKINRYGFSDRDIPPIDGTKKIVFIGDSFVEASQVRYEDKVHVVLEKMLNKTHDEQKFQTAAFGFAGTGQINQLPFYDFFAKQYQPNTVVLVIVSNDLANNSYLLEALRSGVDPLYHPHMSAVKEKSFILKNPHPDYNKHMIYKFIAEEYFPFKYAFKDIFAHSVFYRYATTLAVAKFPSLNFLKGVSTSSINQVGESVKILQTMGYDILKGEENLMMHELDSKFNQEHLSPVFTEALEATDFALQEWQKRADQDGFNLVALLSHSTSMYCQEKSSARDRWVELLNKNHIAYVDQCDTIRKHGRPAMDANYSHDGHWNEQGHAWAAETILPLIEKTLQE